MNKLDLSINPDQIYNALIEQGYSTERANIIWKQ